ncbi:hypothetical protein AB395_00001714 [Sinorhizobium fredii CCBAU 45436]|nr:hypothetical protein AB395_00001714 [Sinorhizobium fredii CCBAU 45436]
MSLTFERTRQFRSPQKAGSTSTTMSCAGFETPLIALVDRLQEMVGR